MNVTVRRRHLSTESASVADGAPRIRVEGHVVGCLRVDALNDINLSTIRPTGTKRPAVPIRSELTS